MSRSNEPYVINRGKLGWAVHWPCGFESAMPTREIAHRCAATYKMHAALKQVVPILVNPDGPTARVVKNAIMVAEGQA